MEGIELNYHSSVEVTAPLKATVLAIVKDLKRRQCETADSVFTHDGVEYLLSYSDDGVVDVEPWDTDSK